MVGTVTGVVTGSSACSGARSHGELDCQKCIGDCDSLTVAVGALVLRGPRCVLVRSLAREWKGMVIPSVTTRAGEAPRETALRAIMSLCDIDADEVKSLPGVAPVYTYVERGGKLTPVALYAFYAVHPASVDSSATIDTEDPDDSYDWYTFPRAMTVLAKDSYACMALASLAHSLAAAVAAGAVEDKWGGVFGHEWASAARHLLPFPAVGGLQLTRSEWPFELGRGPQGRGSGGSVPRRMAKFRARHKRKLSGQASDPTSFLVPETS